MGGGASKPMAKYAVAAVPEDAPPPPAVAAAAAAEPRAPGAAVAGFGARRFAGAGAAPFLAAEGLAPGTLDDVSWPRDRADQVAAALLAWALDRGAVAYARWTMPRSSATGGWRQAAHALEQSLAVPSAGGLAWRLDGRALVFGDAGAGAVLDVRSRCFVRGTVLYLPCVFADYDASACVGEDHVLDQRAPLYRACDDLGAAGGRLLGALAGRGVSGPVELMLGLEQEFYLAPAASAARRPDLKLCGTLLVGGPALERCGAVLDYGYAGASPAAAACLAEVRAECWALGVPVDVSHRETAPGQHELVCGFGPAPRHNEANVLLMDVLEAVARRRGLAALLHEKPSKGGAARGRFRRARAFRETRPRVSERRSLVHRSAETSGDGARRRRRRARRALAGSRAATARASTRT